MEQEASQWDIDIENGRCTHISGLMVEFSSSQRKTGDLNLSIEVKFIPADMQNDTVSIKKLLDEVPKQLIQRASAALARAQ